MLRLYLDVVGVGEEHGKAVDTHSPASSWWQTIFQCFAEGVINEHGFIITLSFGLKDPDQMINLQCYTLKYNVLIMYSIKVGVSFVFIHTLACCSKSSLCLMGSFNSV